MEWLAGKMRAAGIRDIDLTLYPDTRHETLNETVRDRATDAFIVWANRVIAA
jgi:alpha-beta hydrolase superfamily lysophospholipase